MYLVQNWTLLCNNLYVFGQNRFNIDLNYMLKQFLANFETFNKNLKNLQKWVYLVVYNYIECISSKNDQFVIEKFENCYQI